MLDRLRKQCDDLLSTDVEKYMTISNILKNDNCFFEMDIDTAYKILEDLNVKKEDISKVYLDLIKIENYND
ncbi:MAG: hypothetical protein J1F35_07220 [Erysipelotrichales bacterium]|nr:hypothetical protein [Erysipelotrichales bacterium]